MLPGLFYRPHLRGKKSVCYAVIVVAGRTGHIAVPLVAVRVDRPVVPFDAGCENPRRLPSRARRRGANRSKHECRSQCGADLTNHINLLIVGGSADLE